MYQHVCNRLGEGKIFQTCSGTNIPDENRLKVALKVRGGRVMEDSAGDVSAKLKAGQTRTALEMTLDDLFGAVEQEWQEQALCAQTDPEAFFPEKGGSTREAKRICQACPVQDECLEFALEHDERFGIWGGLSERERRRLKRDIS